ncbi:MAG: ABC transporter ATP-binding protein [Candidatus Heimdallarchaeum endolithica]|uniref:ABC transporter ATP-binding protein n=1 Tax=Candidatus Heimdallarchaeum endolithica TaxID=2876572 RepID=A0A9Y1BTR2_9ARCH|nr:MAG: ABC transporter ATP-binding protein [Candidatus Heimdallarchaeum endolithica]
MIGVKVENLKKKFNSFFALKGISLSINKPGLYGLIGPNGAGKTTLFKCITGLLTPTEGKVILNNTAVNRKLLFQKNIYGFIPEDVGLYENLSARDFLHILAGLHGLVKTQRKKRVKEVVDFVGIKYSPNKIVRYLSTGQKRLLLIAGILLHDPDILILDESLSGLDPVVRSHVSNLMKELSKEKIVLYSSHILTDIWKLSDEVFVLNNGILVEHDTPLNIIKKITKNVYYIESNDNEEIFSFLKKVSNIKKIEFEGNKILFQIKSENVIDEFNEILSKIMEKHSILSFGYYEPDLDQLFIKMVSSNED